MDIGEEDKVTANSYLDPRGERFLKVVAVTLITLVAFENLSVTTAMPTVARALDGQSLYALAMGVVLSTQLMTAALAGPWSDARGTVRPLVTGLAMFAAGLLASAFAPTMIWFVVGRAVAGLGGGMVIVPLYAMVGGSVKPARQPSFFAAFAAAWVLPSLIGPAIAGFIVMHWNWRIVFGAVPVLMILIMPLVLRVVRILPPHRVRPTEHILRTVLPAIGAGLAMVALQMVSGAHTFTPLTYAAGVVAAIAGFAFLSPLLPRGTYRAKRGLPATILSRVFLNGCYVAMEMFMPLMLQEVHGWRPDFAGYIVSVGSITWAIGSWASGRITDDAVRARLPFVGAAGTTVVVWMVVLGCLPNVTAWLVVAGWTLAGLFTGVAYPALSVHALGISSLENQGRTSSSLQLADTYGGAFCAAIIGIVIGALPTSQGMALAIAFAVMIMFFHVASFAAARIIPEGGTKAAQRLDDPLHADPRMAEVTEHDA